VEKLAGSTKKIISGSCLIEVMYVASKKHDIKLLPISLPNIDGFLKFFYWYVLWKICNKLATKDHTTLDSLDVVGSVLYGDWEEQ